MKDTNLQLIPQNWDQLASFLTPSSPSLRRNDSGKTVFLFSVAYVKQSIFSGYLRAFEHSITPLVRGLIPDIY